MSDRLTFAQFIANNAAMEDPCSTEIAKGNDVYKAWLAYLDSGSLLPLPRPERLPGLSLTHVWHIDHTDFQRFTWFVNLQKAQVYIHDTTVQDKEGNYHPGTYVALWLGRAYHSRVLWDKFFGEESLAMPHNGYPQLQANHGSILYKDQIAFRNFRRALVQNEKLVLRTRCKGIHTTLAYAGPMSCDWQEEARLIMTQTLQDLIKHRFDESEEKVHRFLNIKKHLIRRYHPETGLTQTLRMRCTYMSFEQVQTDLNNGRIDTSEVQPS